MRAKIKTEFTECIRFSRKGSNSETKKRGFCVLSLRLNGCAEFYQNGISFSATPENILFIPNNAEYLQKGGKEEIIAVHFNASPEDDVNIKTFVPENFELIRRLFIQLEKVFSEKKPGYEYKANSIFFELLYTLKDTGNDKIYEKIQPSIEYLMKNYKKSTLTVTEVASASHISAVYFRRLFLKYYGKTPVKYINELRINYAKSLLSGGYMSVSSAAEQSGFCNEKYFSRVFSSVVGIPPGRYSTHI